MTGARFAPVLLALTVSACGGGGGTAVTTASAPRTVAVRAPVSIVAPRAVSATARAGRLVALVRLAGRAAPGQQLGIRAACTPDPCQAIAFADATGRWRASLTLGAAKGGSRIRLIAAYASPRAGETPARSTVRLVRPRPTRVPAVSLSEAEGGDALLRPYTGRRAVLVIGDSLAVGMAPALRADLAGDAVSIDARVSRPLAEGMAVLAATHVPADEHPVLAFSLFTNDDPSAVGALDAAVRASMARVGGHGCAVWATIRRPPLDGVSYAAANATLEALSADPRFVGRLLVVPWARASASNPGWIAPDGVHATPMGYAARARLYADAIRSCVA